MSTSEKKITIPNFIKNDASYWFIIVERVFASQKIEDNQMKFDLVLQALPEYIQMEIKPAVIQIINSAGQENYQPYDTLKSKVISVVAIPETQRLTQLLEKETIGTRTPSQFLTHLRNLQGDNQNAETDNKYLHHIFLKNMPPNTQAILITQKNQDLEELAKTADLLHNMNTPIKNINKITHELPTSFTDTNMNSRSLTSSNEEILLNKIAKISLSNDEYRNKQHDSDYRITRLEKQLKEQVANLRNFLLVNETIDLLHDNIVDFEP